MIVRKPLNHDRDCLSGYQLPTGLGYWHCDCEYDGWEYENRWVKKGDVSSMDHEDFEALKPGDIIQQPGETQEYIVSHVECVYNDVIVTAVRVIRPKRHE